MIIADLIDEQQTLANLRAPWEAYWRDVVRFTLPQVEDFDMLANGSVREGVAAVVNTPVAAKRSKTIYDMTSLWAVDRLTAGMLSLKTPEADNWHDLNIDSDFDIEPSHEEKLALERLRNYLFRVRGNPKSGFWPSHKAAIKSMCAFGDGWLYSEETYGQRVPIRYQYTPLPEIYPAVGPDGQPQILHRVFSWTAFQIATKWGEAAGSKVLDMANDPTRAQQRIKVLHAVRPRDGTQRNRLGTRGAEFASWYCLPDDKHLIGEGGYYEFPYHRYAWENTGQRAFSEGPVAIALAEIKSLQEMSKNELLASQMALRPPIALATKNFTQLNLNAGAVNPGLISPRGEQLFAPLNAGVRPDFAQAILESRRNSVREMLYLNLWQILIEGGNQTATEAMLRAQEKGEMLGPVGISLNEGLSSLIDRDVSILARKGAFAPGSPLELPDSMQGADVAPQFTSPLDRLRRMGELVGMQRVIELTLQLMQVRPDIVNRLDPDSMIETAVDILGAPVRMLRPVEEGNAEQEQAAQLEQVMGALGIAEQGGRVAEAIGRGGTALAQGAEAAAGSPALQQISGNMANLIQPNALVPTA